MTQTPVADVQLADVVDASSRRTANVRLPPEYFSVLTQVRKTSPVDEDLAISIHALGQMNMGMAAVLTPTHATTYLEELNQIYGTRHTLRNLKLVRIDGELCYLVIFAGHRRHQHVLYVKNQVDKGRYPAPNPVQFDCLYRATLHFEITAEEAIELQFNENRYTAPPLHEEAEAAMRLYRYKLKKSPKLTVSAFARSIGRRAEWVTSALRFCRLPSSIQSYVIGDNPLAVKFPYGVLVDLARLAETYELITGNPMGELAMQQWLMEALVSGLNAAAFTRKVSAYLADKRAQANGQISLFSDEPSPSERQTHVRRVVAQEMVRGLWATLNYAKTVQRLHIAGVLGGKSYLGPHLTLEEQEFFSPKSPVRIWAELLGIVTGMIPDLTEIARSEKMGFVRTLTRGHPLVEEAFTVLSLFAAAEEQAANRASH